MALKSCHKKTDDIAGRPPASNFLLSQIRQPPTELPKDFRPIFEIILHPYQSGALGRASWMSEADRSTRLLHLVRPKMA